MKGIGARLVGTIVLVASACDTPPSCAGRLSDACRKAADLASVAGVQLGDDFASGNAVLGDAGVIGATGKALVSVRMTGGRRDGPDASAITVRTDTTIAASRFSVRREVGTSLSIDGAVGGVRGTRVGGTRIGGIDILGGVTATPNADRGSIHVGGVPVSAALGVRLGVIEETRTLPAITLSAMVRTPRRFSVTLPPLPTDSGESVRLELQQGDLTTLGYRLATSKRLGRIGLTAGIGQDTYYVSTDYVVAGPSEIGNGRENASFNVTRTNMFGGVSYAAGRVTFVAELGRLTGGHVPAMLNTFGSREPTAAHAYLSLGMRIPAGRTVDRD